MKMIDLFEEEKKVSKSSVKYTNKSPNDNEQCRHCVMFRYPNTCALVEGKIDPDGRCSKWYKKK